MSTVPMPEVVSFSIRDDAGQVERFASRPDARERSLAEVLADVERSLDEDRQGSARAVAMIAKRDGLSQAEALDKVRSLIDAARDDAALDQRNAMDPERLKLHRRVRREQAGGGGTYTEALDRVLARGGA